MEYQATAQPQFNHDGCMARCVVSRFHTFVNGQRTTSFHPFSDITCKRCSEVPEIPCAGECRPNEYIDRNGTYCHPCNQTLCGNAQSYRTQCTGHTTQDTECLPCDNALLRNPTTLLTVSSYTSPTLQFDILQQRNRTTRRWVDGPPGLYSGNCWVACINNYMWIDTKTGYPHTSGNLTDTLHCLPCDSDYITTMLYDTTVVGGARRPLYSVWNSTNMTTGPPTRQPFTSPVYGACSFCPPAHDTIATSDVMCESIPGFSTQDQGDAGTAVVVSLFNSTQNSVQTGDASVGYIFIPDRRRHLLQIATQNTTTTSLTVRTIRVRRQPALSIQNSWFACCSSNASETHAERCRAINLQALESKLTAVGSAFGPDYCAGGATVSGRRLLQANGIIACYAGNYKPDRGNSPCYTCPYGASTASDGASDRTACRCLPGFRALRDANGSLTSCIECGANFYRSPLQTDDSRCYPCPHNTFTPTASSAYCYCLAGYYFLQNTQECVPCTAGFYCQADNVRLPCPANSLTPVDGASTRGECKCFAPIYYGDLSRPENECIYVKPGLNCSAATTDARCPCARGWLRVNGECISSCAPGEYAVLGAEQAIERCVPCPRDTYTGTNSTVYIPQLPLARQCTACPTNSHTAGVGTANMQGCACKGAQNGTTCQLCLANQYYDGAKCAACPPGTSSAAASTSLDACMCPRGYRAMRTSTLRCEPCPLGFYSTGVGLSCAQCPSGSTTVSVGAISRLACV
jgi:hypothetical protein